MSKSKKTNNAVSNPKHYNNHPSGVECIQITRHMPSNIANAIKYCWREEDKNGVEDLKKAIWYLADQIDLKEGNSDMPHGWGEQLKAAMKAIK